MDSLQASTHYFIEAWRFFSQRMPSGTFEQLPGLVAAFGGIPMPFLNIIFLDSPVHDTGDLDDRLRRAAEYGNRSGLPWFLALCVQWSGAHPEELLQKHRLVEVMKLRAMRANRLAPPRRALADLRYDDNQRRPETARWIAEINAAAYGLPEEMAAILDQPGLWDEDAFPVVGFSEGEAVCCSAVLPLEDALYVGWVATLPGHQRKGYAEAVMRRSLEVAAVATGKSTSWLHATEAGFPVYQAMGYDATADFLLCTSEQSV